MKRKNGWQQRLQVVFSNSMEKPFEYGFHDCALFVCNCIRAMTGEDPAAGYRNSYRDRKGALNILRKKGLEGIIEQIAASLETREIKPLFAQRGDVLLLDSRIDGPALAIVDLTGEKAWGPGPLGLVSFKLCDARRAWRI